MAELLVTGAGGHLGSVVMAIAAQQGRSCLGMVSPFGPRPDQGSVHALDVRSVSELAAVLARERPRAVMHLAAITSVDRARREPIHTHEINVEVTATLSELAQDAGAQLVFASTDMVFDGLAAPYAENDTPNPLSTYGRSKLMAEAHVMRSSAAVIARLPLLFGLSQVARPPSFFVDVATALRSGQRPALFVDEFRTPLSLTDAARALLRLCDHPLSGVVHLPGAERLSRLQMGRHLAQALQVPQGPASAQLADAEFEEPRPPDLSLRDTRYEAAFGEAPGRSTVEVFQEFAQAILGRPD